MAGLLRFRLQQCVVATACIAVCAIFSGSASAAIIISYGGNTIAAGGTGVLDVLISSDAAVATPDLLDSFSGHFQISPVGGAVPNGLQFATVQAESQLGNTSYVSVATVSVKLLVFRWDRSRRWLTAMILTSAVMARFQVAEFH